MAIAGIICCFFSSVEFSGVSVSSKEKRTNIRVIFRHWTLWLAVALNGWKFEYDIVVGIGLMLLFLCVFRRPCFAKRKAYSVSVKIPSVLPRPPKCHMENFDTFFSNTIPAKPATYTIHPEWMSEILFAKRLELQKREGYKYKHNDFSFIY